MTYLREHCRPFAVLAIAALLAVNLPMPAARAAMVTTERAMEADSLSPRGKVTAFLSRKDVQSQLEAFGVSPAEAKARVASLSDDEVAKIAGRLDDMPAGQDGFGSIIGAALIVFLVLLITDILGFTHVFGFTNKGSARAK